MNKTTFLKNVSRFNVLTSIQKGDNNSVTVKINDPQNKGINIEALFDSKDELIYFTTKYFTFSGDHVVGLDQILNCLLSGKYSYDFFLIKYFPFLNSAKIVFPDLGKAAYEFSMCGGLKIAQGYKKGDFLIASYALS